MGICEVVASWQDASRVLKHLARSWSEKNKAQKDCSRRCTRSVRGWRCDFMLRSDKDEEETVGGVVRWRVAR
jgi:hypothetical protein